MTQSPLERLFSSRLVGVVRAADGERARAIAAGLAHGGFEAIEITQTTPDALESVEGLKRRFPEVCWGVGTVRSPQTVRDAARAGAEFVVSPHVDPEIVKAALSAGLVPIPGALTPTEIHVAASAGAPVVKVFPVSAVGGPAYLRWVRGPLPEVPLWVSGDVALEQLHDYLDAGATLIGLTTALTADLADPVEERAADRARRALAALRRDPPEPLVLRGQTEVEVSADQIRSTGPAMPLEDWLPGRIGRVHPLEAWLCRAGFREDLSARLTSIDGFTAILPVETLMRDAAVQVEAGGRDLSPAVGGPFRLYVRNNDDRCSNLKGLARIEQIQPDERGDDGGD